MKHQDCLVEDCQDAAESPAVLCAHHWRLVPGELRSRLFAAYRPSQGKSGPTEEFSRAVEAVLEHVRRVELRELAAPVLADPLHALTIHQPHATAIMGLGAWAGAKDYENRSWDIHIPEGGRWIAVHAGLRWDAPESWPAYQMACKGLFPSAVRCPRGAILGLVLIDRIVPPGPGTGTWGSGPRCWHIAQKRRLEKPIPCRGHQRLWRVPEHIVRQMAEQGVVPAQRAA